MTNRTVQVFIWFCKLNGIHFCTLAKTIKSATHTKHVKKHETISNEVERREQIKIQSRIFVRETLQTDKIQFCLNSFVSRWNYFLLFFRFHLDSIKTRMTVFFFSISFQ